MTPYHRNKLLELSSAQEQLLWSYAAEIGSNPKACMTAEDLCLADFTRRSLGVIKTLLHNDPRREHPRPTLKPPSPEALQRFHDEVDRHKRETARAQQDADDAEQLRKARARQASSFDNTDAENPRRTEYEEPLPPITDRANSARRAPGMGMTR